MYSPHSLYTPHQAFQGEKSSGLYTEKYGNGFIDMIEETIQYFLLKMSQYLAGDSKIVLAKSHENRFQENLLRNRRIGIGQ